MLFRKQEQFIPKELKEIRAKVLTKKLIDDGTYRDYIISEILLKKEDEHLLGIGEIIYIKKEMEITKEPERETIKPPVINDSFIDELIKKKEPEKIIKEEINVAEITEKIRKELEEKYKNIKTIRHRKSRSDKGRRRKRIKEIKKPVTEAIINDA